MMEASLPQATTTPKISAALKAIKEPTYSLTKPYAICELTPYKWQK
ncbi:MAG: hypothetical protein ACTS73_01245 [Arsenophonus sp. NEOnobi-MAG3]